MTGGAEESARTMAGIAAIARPPSLSSARLILIGAEEKEADCMAAGHEVARRASGTTTDDAEDEEADI